MPTLHVRGVPGPLYKRLQRLAGHERRSLSAQVIALLERSIPLSPARRTALFERIRKRRQRIVLPRDWPGVVAILREDRER